MVLFLPVSLRTSSPAGQAGRGRGQHQQELAAAVAHAAAAIHRRELDSYTRADLLTTLGIFGRLKDRTLDVLSIIGREQMRDSPFYQQLVEEGEQVRARKAVLQVLKARFGAEAAPEFEEAVNRIENFEQLEELLNLAARCRRVSQFRRAISQV
jgi:predicted transposase YdaD